MSCPSFLNSKILAYALALSLLIPTNGLARTLAFPVPSFFELSIVADDLSYSGIAMSVTRFHSRRGMNDIRTFYQTAWPEVREASLDEIYVLSYMDQSAGLLYTLQIDHPQMDASQQQGYLTVSNLPATLETEGRGLPTAGAGIPLHSTAEVINDMRFNDAGRESRLLYVTHTATARTVYEHYQRNFERLGWVVIFNEFIAAEHTGILRLQKGRQRIDITLAFLDSKTQMTLTEMN